MRRFLLLLLPLASLAVGPSFAADLPPGAIIRLGESRFRNGTNPTSIAYSSDGKRIATVDDARNVVVWDAATGLPIRSWNPNHRNAGRLRFSPDGMRLAAADAYNQIRIWEIVTGKELVDETGWKFEIDCIDWTPDSKNVIACRRISGKPDWLVFLNATTGAIAMSTDTNVDFHGIASMCCTSDGKKVLVAGPQGHIGYYDAAKETFQTIGRWNHDWQADGTTLAVAPNGSVASLAGWGPLDKVFTIIQFDPESGNEVGRRMETRKRILSLVYSPDGSSIAANEEKGHIRVWDRATGKERVALDAGGTTRNSLAFSPDGRTLVSVEPLPWVRRWDLVQTREMEPESGHRKGVVFVAFLNDGKRIASGGRDNAILLWDVATGREVARWEPQPVAIGNVAAGLDRKSILLAKDQVVLKWEPGAAREIRKLVESDRRSGGPAALTADGRWAWFDDGYYQELYDTATGQRVHSGEGYEMSGSEVARSPDGRFLAIRAEKAATIWRTATWVRSARAADGEDRVPCFGGPPAFSPDSRYVTGSMGWAFHLLEPATLIVRHRIEDSSGKVAAQTFLPDGRILIMGTELGAVVLYDIKTRARARIFAAHRGTIRAMAVSPDGTRLATAGDDTTVLVWDLKKLRELLPTKELVRRDAKNYEILWTDLAVPNGEFADTAIWGLVAAEDDAVKFLRTKLEPAKKPNAAQIAQWIKDLGDVKFAVRRKAEAALEAAGTDARAAMKAALEDGRIENDAHRRLTSLRNRAETVPAGKLQSLRAIEVLVRIGTPAARTFLAELAKQSDDEIIKPELDFIVKRSPR